MVAAALGSFAEYLCVADVASVALAAGPMVAPGALGVDGAPRLQHARVDALIVVASLAGRAV